MNRQKYRLAWLLSLLIAITVACNALSGIQQDINKTRGTVGAAATDVSRMITEAKGFATSVEESGFSETAAAIVTEEGSQLLGTAQALATEAEERGLLETAQAFATEEGSRLLSTLEAAATSGVKFGEAPEDIPLIAQENIVNFFGSNQLVSFTATLEFEQVVEFYQREMPANGWEPDPSGTTESETSIVLRFVKPNKNATVTVTVNPLDQNAAVVIFIQPQ